jgi:hypothetical protein
LDGEAAHAARAGDDDDRLALGQVGARAQQVPGGRALEDEGERLLVAHTVGDGPGEDVVRDHLLRVPAAVEQADDAPAAADRSAHELRARDQRQLLLGEVGVLDLVGVGEVQAGGGDVGELLTRTWIRPRSSTMSRTSGPPKRVICTARTRCD